MKVYERYIGREIVAATGLVLLAFLLLFAFFDLVHELESIGKGGYQIRHAIGYVALTLPGRVYELSPIAVLIGSLYGLTVLARHSEITVLRASGLATREFLRSLSKLGLVFALVIFLIGEFVSPPAERAAQQLRLKTIGTVVAQEFRSGLWVKDDLSFVNVREVLPDSGLRGIRVYEFDSSFRLRSISEAERGEFLPPRQWRLLDVVQTVFEGERAQVTRLPLAEWKSALNPDILSVLMVMPERMSLATLYQYIRHLSGNQQKTQRYEIAAWKKIVYPLAALVMMMLALPFAYLHDRSGAVSVRIFAGVMIGIGFHLLNGLFSSLGAINDWPPAVSAITPGALFLAGAGGMLWWVERR